MDRMWQGYFSMTVLFLVCTDSKVIRFTLGYSNVMKPGLDESIDMGYLVGHYDVWKYQWFICCNIIGTRIFN